MAEPEKQIETPAAPENKGTDLAVVEPAPAPAPALAGVPSVPGPANLPAEPAPDNAPPEPATPTPPEQGNNRARRYANDPTPEVKAPRQYSLSGDWPELQKALRELSERWTGSGVDAFRSWYKSDEQSGPEGAEKGQETQDKKASTDPQPTTDPTVEKDPAQNQAQKAADEPTPLVKSLMDRGFSRAEAEKLAAQINKGPNSADVIALGPLQIKSLNFDDGNTSLNPQDKPNNGPGIMMDDNGMVVGQNNIMNINGQTLPPGVYKNENGQFKRLEGDDAKAETARLGSEFEKLKAGQRDGQHLGFEGESGNDLVNMTSNPPGMMTRTMSDGTVQLAKDFAQGYRDQNATRQLYAGASHASGAPTAPAAGTPSNGPIIEADYSEVPNNGPDYAGMSAEADENGGGTPASPKATPLIPQPEGPVPKQRALPAPPKQAGPANP